MNFISIISGIFSLIFSIFSFGSSIFITILFLAILFSKLLGVSIATTFPLLIIITFWHIWLISDKICELMKTVWFFLNDFIKFLISITCFGSNPTVGSSKINISGFPIKAPDKLTLCLYPLEIFLISLFSTSARPKSVINFLTCCLRSCLFNPFSSAI